ncbi:uncharacterized protein VTP21DRAFT_2824 [Calcarisporiella thermophila]|uniref:uncharacterized protein n=1 Tax=Calcarisporiella thermophila TaxID=911321 RepID=UPI0037442E1D
MASLVSQRRSYRNSHTIRQQSRGNYYHRVMADEPQDDYEEMLPEASPSEDQQQNVGGEGDDEEMEGEDGGFTRCICGEVHHEGIMIQCEECKVWQHCICVGIVSEKGIPDMYYCEECRPENHIVVRVGNSGRKRHTYRDAKQQKSPTKKRSTMNSRDAALPLPENLTKSARQDLDTRSNKRRKKASSASLEELQIAVEEENKPLYAPEVDNKEGDSNLSAKYPKKTITSKFVDDVIGGKRSRSSSPTPLGSPSLGEEDKMGSTGSEMEGERPAKRKRRTADSDNPRVKSRGASPDDPADTRMENEVKDELGGDDGRASKEILDEPPPQKPQGRRRGGGEFGKRAPKRNTNSRTSTPQPESSSGAPDARAPSPPAKVRYPSAKMTFNDMNKRAKLLLDYITSVQVEMATTRKYLLGTDTGSDSEEKMSSHSKGRKAATKRRGKPGTRVGMEEEREGPTAESPAVSPPSILITRGTPTPTSASVTAAATTSTATPERATSNDPLDSLPKSESAAEAGAFTSKESPKGDSNATAEELSSLEMLDQLTRDLIRFQERFGHLKDIGQHHHYTRSSDLNREPTHFSTGRRR